MTVLDWVRLAECRLAEVGIESARLEAQVLLGHAVGQDRSWVITHPDSWVEPEAADGLLVRRLLREPLAYILGYREFYGRRFVVSPAVLIPRADTEVLVEAAIDWVKLRGLVSPRILDIGTGSGCIAATLALEIPDATVIGTDLSFSALDIAQKNGEQLAAEVEWIQSDLVESVRDRQFDLIVSNPPYIEYGHPLEPEVALFEPSLALYAEDGGLAVYQKLARESAQVLAHGGVLMLEIGYDQGRTVPQIFADQGWRSELRQDLSGNDRVVIATREPS